MKKLVISMIGALCVSAAYAGDQPVVVVDNGVVLYMTTTSVEDVAAVPVAIPGSQATAPGFVANAVPTGAEADLLYARLLKEAEKRGLR